RSLSIAAATVLALRMYGCVPTIYGALSNFSKGHSLASVIRSPSVSLCLMIRLGKVGGFGRQQPSPSCIWPRPAATLLSRACSFRIGDETPPSKRPSRHGEGLPFSMLGALLLLGAAINIPRCKSVRCHPSRLTLTAIFSAAKTTTQPRKPKRYCSGYLDSWHRNWHRTCGNEGG